MLSSESGEDVRWETKEPGKDLGLQKRRGKFVSGRCSEQRPAVVSKRGRVKQLQQHSAASKGNLN